MTFGGSNFPAGLGTADFVEIQVSNGSTCKLDTISYTQLTCITEVFAGMHLIVSPNTIPVKFTVSINGETSSLPDTILGAGVITLENFEPQSASPIIH